MATFTSPKKIEEICNKHDVGFARTKEQGKTVYVLTGFLSAIQAAEAEISGYWIEQSDKGHRLYREDLSWD